MITLGGVVLSDNGSDMIWNERYAHQQADQAMERTLSGRAVIYTGPISGGIPITLEATENVGWVTRDVAQQVMALAATPNAQYILEFDGVDYTVMFRHLDAPAVDLKPQWPRVADESSDYLVGQIKLITV